MQPHRQARHSADEVLAADVLQPAGAAAQHHAARSQSVVVVALDEQREAVLCVRLVGAYRDAVLRAVHVELVHVGVWDALALGRDRGLDGLHGRAEVEVRTGSIGGVAGNLGRGEPGAYDEYDKD